jgi:hypothetical protein
MQLNISDQRLYCRKRSTHLVSALADAAVTDRNIHTTFNGKHHPPNTICSIPAKLQAHVLPRNMANDNDCSDSSCTLDSSDDLPIAARQKQGQSKRSEQPFKVKKSKKKKPKNNRKKQALHLQPTKHSSPSGCAATASAAAPVTTPGPIMTAHTQYPSAPQTTPQAHVPATANAPDTRYQKAKEASPTYMMGGLFPSNNQFYLLHRAGWKQHRIVQVHPNNAYGQLLPTYSQPHMQLSLMQPNPALRQTNSLATRICNSLHNDL